ncbi:TlpA family protein disulfide reductase [Sphingobacterium lumbrici]|uniref:TlpA family protein disulfide reductase n=1 Tax=Sphingobacterium lumbrici TaxID=2559600 RepID=UPI00112A2968|nr:thioredoxin domain-containing protein [Sphingobacterium lumbrici]
MKNFYGGGRGLCYLKRLSHLFKSKNNRSRTLFSFVLGLICVLFSEARAQSAGERAVIGAEEMQPLQIGDTIPEKLWNLPLQVVNHPGGKDTITLNDYRDKKLIILDFWATWCAPCVKSIIKWDSIATRYPNELAALGVHIGEKDNLSVYMNERDWVLPSISEKSSSMLSDVFYTRPVVSRIVWISDNKVMAITGLKGYNIEEVEKILKGETVVLPLNLDWTHSGEETW